MTNHQDLEIPVITEGLQLSTPTWYLLRVLTHSLGSFILPQWHHPRRSFPLPLVRALMRPNRRTSGLGTLATSSLACLSEQRRRGCPVFEIKARQSPCLVLNPLGTHKYLGSQTRRVFQEQKASSQWPLNGS